MSDVNLKIAQALGTGAPKERSIISEIANYLVTDSPFAVAAKSAYSGLTFPGDVYRGESSPYDMGRVLDTAGLIGLSSLSKAAVAPEARELYRNSAGLFSAPQKAARPFEIDYPMGAIADDTGKILYDIEGRPINAQYVAGRNMVGQPDQAVGIEAASDIGGSLTKYGNDASYAGRAAGQISIDPYTGEVLKIGINKRLTAEQAAKTYFHEIGHVIDEISGQIPTDGLSRELKPLFNTLNTGREKTTGLMGPEHMGYSKDDIPREYIAEAVRSYLTNPNYIKTVAPKTAERIRKYVNENEKLKSKIQFNATSVPVVGMGQQNVPQDEFSRQYLAGSAT